MMKPNVLIGLWVSAIVLAAIGASRLALSQPARPNDPIIRINLTEVAQKLRELNGNKLSVQQRVQLQQTQQNVQIQVTQLLKSQPLLVLRMLVKSPKEAKQLLADFAARSPFTLEQEFDGIQLNSQQRTQVQQARATLRSSFDLKVREYSALPMWLIVLPDVQATRLYEQTLAKSVETYVDDVAETLTVEQQQRWQQNWLQAEARLSQ